MLWGDRPFTNHWAYWQDLVDMMNASNPSGTVMTADLYGNLLLSALGLSVAVTIKRSLMGHVTGKRTVGKFSLHVLDGVRLSYLAAFPKQ